MKKNEMLTEEQLAELNAAYPVSEDSGRISLPKFGMLSKDITETVGKGKEKTVKILQSAGTFYTERDLGETDEEGKKVWTKEYIEGDSVGLIIAFHRYQLRKFDAGLNKFISTPIYDTEDQILPLYLDKQIIKRGTEKELQSCYPALTAKGKPTSDLKKETILFVIYNGELFQMNISTSSGWEFSSYKRGLNPSTVLTDVGSIEASFGSNVYRKLTFKKNRFITGEEFEFVKECQGIMKETVQSDAAKFILPPGAVQGSIEGKVEEENNAF